MKRRIAGSRSGEDPSFIRARRSLRKLQQNFEENYPGRAKFQRVLGHGGYGLATMVCNLKDLPIPPSINLDMSPPTKYIITNKAYILWLTVGVIVESEDPQRPRS